MNLIANLLATFGLLFLTWLTFMLIFLLGEWIWSRCGLAYFLHTSRPSGRVFDHHLPVDSEATVRRAAGWKAVRGNSNLPFCVASAIRRKRMRAGRLRQTAGSSKQ